MKRLLYSERGKIYIEVITPLAHLYIDITKPEEVLERSVSKLGLSIIPSSEYMSVLKLNESSLNRDFTSPLVYSNL